MHLCQQLTRLHELRIEEYIVETNNVGSFYRFINRRIYDRPSIGAISLDNYGSVLTDDHAKATALNNYFASVCSRDNGVNPECDANYVTCLSSVNIDEADVIAAIDRLKNNFTSGPDGLPPVFFRHLKYAIAKPLAIIFKQLLSVAYIPEEWKKSHNYSCPQKWLYKPLF